VYETLPNVPGFCTTARNSDFCDPEYESLRGTPLVIGDSFIPASVTCTAFIDNDPKISDEEFENLRANAPDREIREAKDRQHELEDKILADIGDQGEKHEEAVAFISGFLVGNQQYDGPGILLDDFIVDLSNELQQTPEVKLGFNEVLDIAYKLNLKPSSFYFGVDVQDEIIVVITPIVIWEQEKRLDDNKLVDHILPDWLNKLSGSRFEIKDDMSPSKVRKELLKSGFIENHDIVG